MFDLALKNIKGNMKQYALYIGATIFSIMIYFTFATLRYSDNISSLASSSTQIKGVMTLSQFILIIFVSIFILYSNSFFMKKRKKEIGIYTLLGIRKGRIGWMLWLENMVIGLVSLFVGVVLGFLFSQVFLLLLLKLMGLALTVELTFSWQALINTVIVFLIIFFITALINDRMMYRYRLIELFQASKKSERAPRANPWIVILGLAAIAAGYSIALADLWESKIWSMFGIATPIVIVGLTIIGSYFLFSQVFIKGLSFLRRYRPWSWKNLNLLTSTQLLHRIRANARSLTIIATLSATTITAGGAIFGLYYSTEKNVEQFMPFSFMWEGEDYELPTDNVRSYISFEVKDLVEKGEMDHQAYNVISETDFLKLAEAKEWEDLVPLSNEQRAFLIDPFYREELGEKKEAIMLAGQLIELDEHFERILLNIDLLPGETIVLSDQAYADLAVQGKEYQAVELERFKDELALSEALEASIPATLSSSVKEYHQTLQQSGALIFVGSFLGIVFLFAMGSIIFFKMMTEAEEDKEMYRILHKIGVNDREMKRTIQKQMLFVFLAPLLLGLSHAAIALTAFSRLLFMNLMIPVLLWMLGYGVIYLIFYVVTVKGFYRTIKEGE